MNEDDDKILTHFGIKGMRWGVIREKRHERGTIVSRGLREKSREVLGKVGTAAANSSVGLKYKELKQKRYAEVSTNRANLARAVGAKGLAKRFQDDATRESEASNKAKTALAARRAADKNAWKEKNDKRIKETRALIDELVQEGKDNHWVA